MNFNRKPSTVNRQPPLLHRAPWVAPVLSPLIEDGGVLCENGRISAVGRFSDLRGCGAPVKDHEGCILTPALVNAHTHLELAHLRVRGDEERFAGDMVDWIRSLLARRASHPAWEGDSALYASGTLESLFIKGHGLVADVGNEADTDMIARPAGGRLLRFLEFLGFSRTAEERALARLAGIPAPVVCAAHSPYSTGPALIRALKDRSRRNGQVFSIHAAESPAEIEFLMNGGGRMQTLLRERGGWDGSFVPPATGAINYLDRLGVLDDATMCVHAVHVSQAETALLAERGARVCLCPGSNRYLGVGRARTGEFIRHGILPALGTDSPASNQVLSIWLEMQTLSGDDPGLDPETVFAMATRGGAEALGMDAEWGCLAAGRTASMLAVRSEAETASEVFEFLTGAGEGVKVEWV